MLLRETLCEDYLTDIKLQINSGECWVKLEYAADNKEQHQYPLKIQSCFSINQIEGRGANYDLIGLCDKNPSTALQGGNCE